MYRLLMLAMIVGAVVYVVHGIRAEIRKASLRKLDKVMLPDGVQGQVTAIEKWEDMKLYGVLRDDGILEYYKRDQIIKRIE
jgi:hypothetical protein